MSIEPQDPVPETFAPEIHTCLHHPTIQLVSHDSSKSEYKQVEVIRCDGPQHAYMVISSMGVKNLDHHAPGWGLVCFGICLQRVEGDIADTFQAPNPQDCQHVAIKRLNKAVVQETLDRGKNENPYKEITRMQELGDDIHVLSCIEALQDDNYLYIIMPYCEQKSLADWIPWNQGVQEHQAREIFTQILENMLYLQKHNICHRDMSPDNCMVYNGRIVFNDLAMSFRIPESGWVTPLSGFGKPPYLSPEVFMNYPFEGIACDLWSIAVVLFNLLTGQILCSMPIPQDLKFRYFILAQGISRTQLNEQTYEVLMDAEDETAERKELEYIIQKCLSLSPEAQELLQGALMVSPYSRWRVEHIQASRWMNQS